MNRSGEELAFILALIAILGQVCGRTKALRTHTVNDEPARVYTPKSELHLTYSPVATPNHDSQ